ncbi:MAG: MMPL family transporter [Crocinitomicaceae bacterium]|nr:MMPL family transporter [Crocinitomicaceae bacterium]
MVGETAFKKYIWIALTVFVGLTAFFGYQVMSVRLDYDFDKFFPLEDEETNFFMEFREKFKSENDFLLIAIENESGAFDKEFLQKVDALTTELETVDNVDYVNSITNQEEYFLFQTGATDSKPYIDFDDFDVERDSTRIFKNNELINSLISENGNSIGIYLRHFDYLSKKKSDQLIVDIEALTDKYEFEKIRIGGRTVQQKYYIDKMTYEMIMFVGMSGFLIILFLAIAFKSMWGVIIPQVVIVSAMLWVVGGMGVFGASINIILTVLPTIMFVVSMSNVIHLVSRYLDALRDSESVFDSIKTAVSEVGMATLLTSITTAVGFFSLCFVRIQPIQLFGFVMGCGVLIAFILTFLMLPVLFYLFPGPKHIREKKEGSFWKKHLEKWFGLVMRRKKAIVYISGAVVILSVIGIMQIRTDNFLLDDLRESESLKQDFNFLDENYGGVRPFEMVVLLNDPTRSVWDKEVLQTLDTVEQYLANTYGVNIRNSLVTTMKVAHRSAHAGSKDYYIFPNKKSDIKSYRRNIRLVDQGEFVYTMVDTSETMTRISGSIPDIGNTAITAKNDSLFAFLEGYSLDGALEFKLTGTAHLVDKNLKYLSVSLVKGLGISIIIVAFLIGLIYRSTTILIICMVTNVLPLLFIAGLMGYLGVELKTSTSIIFTIAFGIAVDDTIHFLGKFKHELLKGKGKMYALKRSYLTTGKAMVLTTLILCAGFLLLIFSSFLGTFYLGLMLCITLMVALIADITLLPVLLLMFYKPKSKK